jgi:ubiquinone/menaquinone biosynthesis C-methylase UbiE
MIRRNTSLMHERNLKTRPEDPLYARFLAHLTRAIPDFDFGFVKPVRQKAVALLNLKNGDRVLDAGCGSGGSFLHLIQIVGKTGEIVGVEISFQTIRNTKKRIENNKWENVHVVEGDVKSVNLPGTFDGLLMFAAPDVYDSEQALSNIFPHLRANSRVVIFGAKISKRRFGWLLNGLLRFTFARLSSATPNLNSEPWRMLEKRLQGFQMKEYFFGWMFLGHGSVPDQIKIS